MGPPADVVSLARWAAGRWAGRTVHLLRTASPPRVVTRPASVPGTSSPAFGSRQRHDEPVRAGVRGNSGPGDASSPRNDDLFEHPGAVTVLRCPPADDGLEVARAAARRGDALIVVPALADARRIAADLRGQGVRVALGSDDWARAAAGGHGGRAPAPRCGCRCRVWPRWWCSMSTPRACRASRPRRGTPARWAWSGPGGLGRRLCWCRPCRRWRPWRQGELSNRRPGGRARRLARGRGAGPPPR